MELSSKILSDITVYMKYAKYLPELNRRETWDELVTRNKEMHQKINKHRNKHQTYPHKQALLCLARKSRRDARRRDGGDEADDGCI